MKRFVFIGSLIGIVVLGWWFWQKLPSFSANQVFTYSESFVLTGATETPKAQPVTLLFGGDIMMDRYIRTVMNRKGNDYILYPLRETLAADDLVIANLEGPITDRSSVSETSKIGEAKNYVFTFPPESAAVLKKEGIGIVNLGNNHILNFGQEGVQMTEDLLTRSGVEYFGSPIGEKRTVIKNLRGMKIGLVNYNQFTFQGREKALVDIALVRPAVDVLILYAHWGKEYAPVLPAVRDLAHEFIDAGVDVLIGSHPHVVQEREVYQGKTIYYSLGNFVFDQYQDPITQQGLLVKLSVDPSTKQTTFEELPIILKPTGQTVLATTP